MSVLKAKSLWPRGGPARKRRTNSLGKAKKNQGRRAQGKREAGREGGKRRSCQSLFQRRRVRAAQIRVKAEKRVTKRLNGTSRPIKRIK